MIFEIPQFVLIESLILIVWLIATIAVVILLTIVLWYAKGLPWMLIRMKIKSGGALALVMRPDRNLVPKIAKVEGDSWYIQGYGRFLTNRKTTFLISNFPGRSAIFLSSMSFAQSPRVNKALSLLKNKGYKTVQEVVEGTQNYIKDYRTKVLENHLLAFQERAKTKGLEIPSELPTEYVNMLEKQGLLSPPKTVGGSILDAMKTINIEPPMGYDGWSVDINEISDWVRDYITPQQMENIVKKTRADTANDILSNVPGSPKRGGMNKMLLVSMIIVLIGAAAALYLLKSGALNNILAGM